MKHSSNANKKAISDRPDVAVRRALFIRALEENSGDKPLSRAAERFFEDEAGRSGANFERLVLERAAIAQKDLERRWNVDLTPLFATDRRRSVMITTVITVTAFLLGLFSNVLDRGPVNILLNAFILLLVWHVLVYFLMGLRAIFSHRLGKFLSDVRPGPVESALSWLFNWFDDVLQRFKGSRKAEIWHKIISAQPRFRIYAAKQFSRVLRLRLMARLNTMAIFSTLGVIAGMYLAGLVYDYRFTWHSTFIGESETVEAFLSVVFGPVLFFFQRELPDLAAQGVGVPGAEWIHLFAQTALIYVVVPRAVIAFLSYARAKSVSQICSLDLNDPYFVDLLRPYRGKDLTVLPMAFSYTPDEERSNRLHALMKRAFGDRAEMQALRNLAWGDTFDIGEAGQGSNVVVILFNGVQTPEHDVHGALVEQAIERLEGTNEIGKLCVLIDISDLEPDRRGERQKLWETVLFRAGVEHFNPVDLSNESSDEVDIYVMGEEN